MRIIHTADWHLGDKLGVQDRTEDIFRAVERVLDHCVQTRADVLLVAGDVFENHQGERFSVLVCRLAQLLAPHLENGLRTIFIPGNHDREYLFRLLHAVQAISSREAVRNIHFVSGPRVLTIADPSEQYGVQFVLAPYPAVERYLPHDAGIRGLDPDQRRQVLADAFRQHLAAAQSELDPQLPAVLAAHVYVRTAETSGLLRMSEAEDIPIEPLDLPAWAYTALGHIHKAQQVSGRSDVRYSGSIERMDSSERNDSKSCVLVNVGATGLLDEPELLGLPSTPMHVVDVADTDDLTELAQKYADRDKALVHIRLGWHPELGGPAAILAQLHDIFPRVYRVDARPIGETSVVHRLDVDRTDFAGTVRAFLESQLEGDPRAERLLRLAHSLAMEVQDASATA